jgi:hypothetical protein
MQPRLKTSKKWTAFPREYAQQIEGVFRQNFADQIGEQKLVIEGRIYTEEVTLRVGLHDSGRLGQANFEVSMDYSPKAADAVERIHNCIDAAASMMVDFFESDGEVEFPRVWKPYPFQNKTIFLQFSTVNTDLEAQADALLGKDDAALVQEAVESEDAMDRADQVLESPRDHDHDGDDEGEDEDLDPEDDDGKPRMFGGPRAPGKKKKTEIH